MMGWYNDGVGWGGWILMTLAMVAFWALVVFAVLMLFRGSRDSAEATPDHRDPIQILDERFARGEIDEDEYHARLDGKTFVVFGVSYGIGGDIADLARSYGATVKTFSRSATNTHVQRREDVVAACREVLAETGFNISETARRLGMHRRTLARKLDKQQVK